MTGQNGSASSAALWRFHHCHYCHTARRTSVCKWLQADDDVQGRAEATAKVSQRQSLALPVVVVKEAEPNNTAVHSEGKRWLLLCCAPSSLATTGTHTHFGVHIFSALAWKVNTHTHTHNLWRARVYSLQRHILLSGLGGHCLSFLVHSPAFRELSLALDTCFVGFQNPLCDCLVE